MVRSLAFALVIALALATPAIAACVPVLDDSTTLVTGPSLLAVASLPAEAAPPASVSYDALYVTVPGQPPPPAAGLSWAFCTARLSLTDQGTVSPECIAPSGESLVPIGAGLGVTAPLPMDGCRLFGPDAPAPVNGQPAGRPVDPDPTGGYYQPVRLEVPATAGAPISYVIGATRIACGLAGATAPVSAQFEQEYRDNTNPAIASLSLVQSSGIAAIPPGAEAGVKVARGSSVTLRAAWAACPTAPVCGDGVCEIEETPKSCPTDCNPPKGCTGSEQYLLFDPQAMALSATREAIQVAWYTTGGTLADDTSGHAASEAGSATLDASCANGTECVDNTWTVPATPGEVLLWVVVRDDRGGVGWQSYRVDVE
jgi:hypothetical protein